MRASRSPPMTTAICRRTLAVGFVAVLAGCAAAAPDDRLVTARYAEPVDRYGHFALGRPHEYARLVATTDQGRTVELSLPDDEVFEDVTPRIVRLAAGEPQLVLAIVSARASGSRLVLLGLQGGRLATAAQSAPIGTPNRWLNPVGVADLDGDGRAEIAAVVTPHIGGTLKVYRREGAQLVEVAALAGFSNHAYGMAEQALSMPTSMFGSSRLLVPSTDREWLRVVALHGTRLVETGRCRLAAPVVGPMGPANGVAVAVGLRSGTVRLGVDDCGG